MKIFHDPFDTIPICLSQQLFVSNASHCAVPELLILSFNVNSHNCQIFLVIFDQLFADNVNVCAVDFFHNALVDVRMHVYLVLCF